MRTVEQTKRIQRLRLTEKMPLVDVIERRLVKRLDWQVYAGAVYPSPVNWRRDSGGRLRYSGPVATKESRKAAGVPCGTLDGERPSDRNLEPLTRCGHVRR